MIYGRKVVALCISRLHDIENARFIEELNKQLSACQCSLWIYNLTADLYWNDKDFNAEESVFDLIDYSITDALIIMEEKIKSKAVSSLLTKRAHANGVPVVIVDGSSEETATVHYDYARGFEQIVRHVIDCHGARNLHFMGGMPGNPFSDERLEVFRRVLAEKGLPFNDRSVSYGNFWAKPAKAATEEIVARGNLPDAIICANDIMAINASTVLQEHEIRVPEDVIVTGFDGIDEIFFAEPRITSVRCGTSGFAESVFRAAMDCMQYGQTTRAYLVEPSLILNESCGCSGNENLSLGHVHSFNDRFYRYQDDNRMLASISERIQKSPNLQEACWCLYDPVLHDMSCIVDPRCKDNTINLLESNDAGIQQQDTMLLFFDTDEKDFLQRSIRRSDIIPHLEERISYGMPLIFNAMSFMNVSLGYFCFHFKDYEITDYCKIPQIITMISFGIGGFMSRQNQLYLRSRVEDIYKYDALTGLHNRISFNNAVASLKQKYKDEEIPVTIIMSDLDGLKTINDSFGHAAGDQAIVAAAEALQHSCPPESICVRFGGDEMIAVVPGSCDTAGIEQSIHNALDLFNLRSGLAFHVSTSLGIHTTRLTQDLDLEKILHFADADLYQEKQAKKAKAAQQ